MLTFAGKTIPGSHGSIIGGGPELQVKNIHYWETVGEAEIVGALGGRILIVQHTLHNHCDTPAELVAEINKLKSYIGQVGSLRERSGDIDITHFNCSFRPWEPDVLPGQPDPGMLFDEAGTLLGDDGEPDNGWFITLLLQFRQLHYEGNTR